MRSLLRPASTDITLLPAALSACIMGSIGATPTPPPAHKTVPNFSICVACPKGPTISSILSPASNWHRRVDERPTAWTTSVMVPSFTSASEMVSGIRSPFTSILTMTKWPALRDLAIKGAFTTSWNTFSENWCFATIVYILTCYFCLLYFSSAKIVQFEGKSLKLA